MTFGRIRLTKELVQAVRDAVDVVAIASEHTRLTKQGRQYGGLCPLHKEKTPSFSVDPEKGVYYCFGCGAGGDAIGLHMQATGDDFAAAIESLALRYGIPLPEPGDGGRDRDRGPDLQPALEAAAAFYRRTLGKAPGPQSYLADRQVPQELIRSFELGYAPEAWRELQADLAPRISRQELLAAGLIVQPDGGKRPYDRFRNRLIFPIHNAAGRLVGFGGRTLGDDKAKYINTNETDQFHKGRLLYGLFQAKRDLRETRTALLVEGYFDVIGSLACGCTGAIAGMGTALTPEQARLLSRYADLVVVGYDGDNAGENAFRRALPLLLAEGLEVRRAHFGEGQDPDSLRLEKGPEAVREAVDGARDAVQLELDRLIPGGGELSPQEKARRASEIADVLRPIPDAIVRRDYGRRAAQRLDVPEELLWKRVKTDPRAARSRRPEPPPARPREEARGPRLVTSLEEQVLALLLAGENLPPPDELPSENVFFDPSCRNIYRSFCVLYDERDGRPPATKVVMDRLTMQEGPVDRVAQILLQSSSGLSLASLPALLDRLLRRWQQQRLRELAREISEAQRQGDQPRLESLLSEKIALSQKLHRGPDRDPASGVPSGR